MAKVNIFLLTYKLKVYLSDKSLDFFLYLHYNTTVYHT